MILAKTLIFAGIVAALSPGISAAQDTRNQGYLVDSYGNSITTSSNTGLCWRDSDWTMARSVEPCDPVARTAEAPAPKMAAMTPPPVEPAPAPVKALPQKFSFSADALFDFDKSVIKPEGKKTLDAFAHDLTGVQYSTITVIGQTDRIGNNQYNQKLSERRAHAVKDYLVSRNIPADHITASGKGETQPVTKAGDCTGPTTKKLIACLQPDRRVDIDVTGTRNIVSSAQ